MEIVLRNDWRIDEESENFSVVEFNLHSCSDHSGFVVSLFGLGFGIFFDKVDLDEIQF